MDLFNFQGKKSPLGLNELFLHTLQGFLQFSPILDISVLYEGL